MKNQATDGLLLVPQSFLKEISESQEKILELLARQQEAQHQLGDFISEAEAAKLLGRKTTWFWNLRTRKQLPYTKVGNKVWYSRQDILSLMEQNKRGGSQ